MFPNYQLRVPCLTFFGHLETLGPVTTLLDVSITMLLWQRFSLDKLNLWRRILAMMMDFGDHFIEKPLEKITKTTPIATKNTSHFGDVAMFIAEGEGERKGRERGETQQRGWGWGRRQEGRQ